MSGTSASSSPSNWDSIHTGAIHMEKSVSAKQIRKLFDLLDQKGTSGDDFQRRLDSGVLADVFDPSANLADRAAIRTALKLGILEMSSGPGAIIATFSTGTSVTGTPHKLLTTVSPRKLAICPDGLFAPMHFPMRIVQSVPFGSRIFDSAPISPRSARAQRHCDAVLVVPAISAGS